MAVPLASTSNAATASTRGRAERDHGGDRRQRTQQHRMRHSGQPVARAEQRTDAEADQDHAVDRSMDRRDDLPAQGLAMRAEQAAAGDAHLVREARPVAEQEEQRREGEGEQHAAMRELCAELPAEAHDLRAVDPTDQRLRVGRVDEVLAPPGRRLRGAERQPGQPVGRCHAVGANIGEQARDDPDLATKLHGDQRQGHDE